MQLEVEALKLYDSMVSTLELTIRDVPKVVFIAYYIQGESGFFQEFKTWDGIRRSKR
jgi:hypothetical protein